MKLYFKEANKRVLLFYITRNKWKRVWHICKTVYENSLQASMICIKAFEKQKASYWQGISYNLILQFLSEHKHLNFLFLEFMCKLATSIMIRINRNAMYNLLIILLVEMLLLSLSRERHFQDTEKCATIHPSHNHVLNGHIYTQYLMDNK